jgi:chemotaxis protein methyltransferase CheR
MHKALEMTPSASLTPVDFEKFRRLAYDTFGLDLRDGKEQLVSARLMKLMTKLEIRSYKDYYNYVTSDPSGQALTEMVDVLTTNHTSFLRESSHFDFLVEQALPEWGRRTRIRIWCAASSTGEEPYSIAFSLLEKLNPGQSIEILATDISTRVLETARRGIYPVSRLENLPPAWIKKYLLRGQNQSEGFFRVKPEVRSLIQFQRLNLVEPLPNLEPFPAIFCRNVMIYFDRPTQERVVKQLAACLEPGGYLFIGHAESLSGIDGPLRYVKPAIYRKPPARLSVGENGRRG